jgi:hypothetical protein
LEEGALFLVPDDAIVFVPFEVTNWGCEQERSEEAEEHEGALLYAQACLAAA